MTTDDLEGHEDVLAILRDGAGLLDHIEAASTDAIWTVHFDDVGLTDVLVLDQLEPVTARAVERLALAWDQARDDLIEDRDLVGVAELDDVRIIGAPDLLHLAVVDHFAHFKLPCGGGGRVTNTFGCDRSRGRFHLVFFFGIGRVGRP